MKPVLFTNVVPVAVVFLFTIQQSFNFPLPGGVSQVGFTIYQNKEAAERARNPQGLHSVNKKDRVVVTYSIGHPTNSDNQGADISKDFRELSEQYPSYAFNSHQQHQKQMEMIRLAQLQETGAIRDQSQPQEYQRQHHTFSHVNMNNNNYYSPEGSRNGAKVYSENLPTYSYSQGLRFQQQQYQPQESSTSAPFSYSQYVNVKEQEQKPYFFSSASAHHVSPSTTVSLNSNLNNIENPSLKEALDNSYPLQYY